MLFSTCLSFLYVVASNHLNPAITFYLSGSAHRVKRSFSDFVHCLCGITKRGDGSHDLTPFWGLGLANSPLIVATTSIFLSGSSVKARTFSLRYVDGPSGRIVGEWPEIQPLQPAHPQLLSLRFQKFSKSCSASELSSIKPSSPLWRTIVINICSSSVSVSLLGVAGFKAICWIGVQVEAKCFSCLQRVEVSRSK